MLPSIISIGSSLLFNLSFNLILAVFLGGLLALVFALISEFLNRIVRTKADLEEFLDIPVLAEIPKFSK